MDAVSTLVNIANVRKITPPKYEYDRNPEALSTGLLWMCELSFDNREVKMVASTMKEAARMAAEEMVKLGGYKFVSHREKYRLVNQFIESSKYEIGSIVSVGLTPNCEMKNNLIVKMNDPLKMYDETKILAIGGMSVSQIPFAIEILTQNYYMETDLSAMLQTCKQNKWAVQIRVSSNPRDDHVEDLNELTKYILSPIRSE